MAEKYRVHWRVWGHSRIQEYEVVNLLERTRFGCLFIGPETAVELKSPQTSHKVLEEQRL
jgi:hypothetical protein